MKERVKFILEWEKRRNEGEGQLNLSELCRVFGITRQAGHRWVKRYQDAQHNLRAMEERSRRPRNSPTAISEETQDVIVSARKKYPRWGPRKLRAWLIDQNPGHGPAKCKLYWRNSATQRFDVTTSSENA